MWRLIQGYDKKDFVKEYQDGQHNDNNILFVDTGNDTVRSTEEITIKDFVQPEILVLVMIVSDN